MLIKEVKLRNIEKSKAEEKKIITIIYVHILLRNAKNDGEPPL